MKFRKSKKDEWPDRKTLKEMRDLLSDPNYVGGSFGLSPDTDEVDKAKYQLCQMVIRYKLENQLLQKDIAEKMGVDESRVSDILRGKIDGFTLDRFFIYVTKLHPGLRLQIIAA